MAGLENNFALNTFTLGGKDIGQIRLDSYYPNGIYPDEALYVHNLNIEAGSYLDLNGYDFYYV